MRFRFVLGVALAGMLCIGLSCSSGGNDASTTSDAAPGDGGAPDASATDAASDSATNGDACVPVACTALPPMDECGTVDDGCGGTLDLVTDCGRTGCAASDVCASGTCVSACPVRADCSSSSVANHDCGVVPDGCGGTIDIVNDCGDPECGSGEVCTTGRFGSLTCGSSCTPLGCGDFSGVECGAVGDGCGNVIDLEATCGAPGCSGPETCGGGGVAPNSCGNPACQFPERTCADFATQIADANTNGTPLCGVIPDGCGGMLDLVADCGAPGCGACTHGTAPSPQCNTLPNDLSDSKVCLENAAGCPGEIVGVEVRVLLPTSCAEQTTSQRSALFDLAGFEVLNQRNATCGEEKCIRRDEFGGSLEWAQFPNDAIGCSTSQCPSELPGGHVDTILMRIPAGQAAGDHPLARTGGVLLDPCNCPGGGSCGVNDPAVVAPTIRVF